MAAIGIDFGSSVCRLAYLPAGSTSPQDLGQPVFTWQTLGGKADSYPYLVLKSTLQPVSSVTQIFKHLRVEAEHRCGQPVSACVVGIPVDAGNLHREQLRKAVQAAGFQAVQLIGEPAALVFGLFDQFQTRRPVLIYMLGESALTISVYKLEGSSLVELASKRSIEVSGDRITRHLAKYLAGQFADESVPGTDMSVWRAEAERIKVRLSSAAEEKLQIAPALLADRLRSGTPDLTVRRKAFEEVIQPLLQQSLDMCTELLASAHLKVEDVGDLWLSGSSKAIPLLGRTLAEWFGRGPVLIDDNAIALGCAKQSARMAEPAKLAEEAPVHDAFADTIILPAETPVLQKPHNDVPVQAPRAGDGAKPPLPIVTVWEESERCMAAGDFEGALKVLEQVNVLLREKQGQIYYRAGKAAEEKALLPAAPNDLLERAAAFYRRAVDMDTNNAEYKHARQRIEDIRKRQMAREKYKQAQRYVKEQRWYDAAECIRSACTYDPAEEEYRIALAKVLMARARANLQQIIDEVGRKGGRRENCRKWIDEIDRWTKEARKAAPNEPVVIEESAYIWKTIRQLGWH